MLDPDDLIAFLREYNLTPSETAGLTPRQIEVLRAGTPSQPEP